MREYVRKRIHRFSKRKAPDFPNKCDICGLRAKYVDQDQDIDTAILKAGELQKCGLAKNYPREMHVTIGGSDDEGHTYFCVLSNIKYWNKRFKKCPDWQLRIGNKLSLSDYLSIHHSRNNTRIALKLGVLAAILTAVGIIASLCSNL